MFEKYIDIILDNYHRGTKVNMSRQFLICCYTDLEANFNRITGIKMNNRVQITSINRENFFVESGEISRMPICLFINHNWITFIICWQSKSGKIYRPEDEVTDCGDLKFWFENLDVALVNQCMYPGGELPFKTDNLGYDLEVQGLDMDMHLRLYFLAIKEIDAEAVMLSIDNHIDAFNLKSEKKNRDDGVVHNWKRRLEERSLVYELDLGSSGLKFLAGLLKHFAKLGLFEKVVIGGD